MARLAEMIENILNCWEDHVGDRSTAGFTAILRWIHEEPESRIAFLEQKILWPYNGDGSLLDRTITRSVLPDDSHKVDTGRTCYLSVDGVFKSPSLYFRLPQDERLLLQDMQNLNDIVKSIKIAATPTQDTIVALEKNPISAFTAKSKLQGPSFDLASLHQRHIRDEDKLYDRILCLVKYNIINQAMDQDNHRGELFRSLKSRTVNRFVESSWGAKTRQAFLEDIKIGMKLSSLPRGSSLGFWDFKPNDRIGRLSKAALSTLAAWTRNNTNWADFEDLEYQICLAVSPVYKKYLPVEWVEQGMHKRPAEELPTGPPQKRPCQWEVPTVHDINKLKEMEPMAGTSTSATGLDPWSHNSPEAPSIPGIVSFLGNTNFHAWNFGTFRTNLAS